MRTVTTTEIYYDKGYRKGKADMTRKVLKVMDKMNKLYGTKNRLFSKDWNDGYDDALRAIYAELEPVVRGEE
ncbi:MAG: hypothetical protein IKF42_06300 [Mogibacterium sp.]|nr:hypothetical protein [Mogibacterium sp.]